VKDFTPIAVLADVANVLVVAPDSPYGSVAALTQAIEAQPVNKFSFSSSGVGTSHHIAGVVLGQYLDKPLMHVAYTGAPQGLVAVMSKEVNLGPVQHPCRHRPDPRRQAQAAGRHQPRTVAAAARCAIPERERPEGL
jgi:tripartite-type tricarboxylate transporter receptor subunit TctC